MAIDTTPVPVRPQSWFSITPQNEGTYDIIRIIPQVGTAALYSISAADKAKAVPFIKLWKLEGDPYKRSNKKLYPPLSDTFTRSPNFGSQVQYGERPDASIESLQIKRHLPKGLICISEIQLSVVVHRPDTLNRAETNENSIGKLLTPGNVFLLEYGWVGGDNAIIGRGMHRKEIDPEYLPSETKATNEWKARVVHAMQEAIKAKRAPANAEIPPRPEFYGALFPAVSQLRFIITHYSFSFTADGQIRLSISGLEDAELQVLNATIFDQGDIPEPQVGQNPQAYLQSIADYFNAQLQEFSFEETIPIDMVKERGGGWVDAKLPPTPHETFIELQDVLNVLFVKPILNAIRPLGYNHIHLYTGVFNEFAPDATPAYGGKSWRGQPIGEYWMRLHDVRQILNQIVATKGLITIYNLLTQLIGLIVSPGAWVAGSTDVTRPDVILWKKFDPRSGYARFQIIDTNRYLTTMKGPGLKVHANNYDQKRLEIRRALKQFLAANRSIPQLILAHQSAFIKDIHFEVMVDDKVRSIFTADALKKSRQEQVTPSTGTAGQAIKFALPQGLYIFRSSLRGTVTMLGNFVYDIPGMFWVTFGIWALDGLFISLDVTDKVDRTGFTTTITLQSQGTNPLGAAVPPPVTAQDWAAQKQMIQGWNDAGTRAWASGTVAKANNDQQASSNALVLPVDPAKNSYMDSMTDRVTMPAASKGPHQ